LGGEDQEDLVLRPALAKIISTDKLGRVVCICNPSYSGRIQAQNFPRQKNARPYLKIN
jgi:hypothetical protein